MFRTLSDLTTVDMAKLGIGGTKYGRVHAYGVHA